MQHFTITWTIAGRELKRAARTRSRFAPFGVELTESLKGWPPSRPSSDKHYNGLLFGIFNQPAGVRRWVGLPAIGTTISAGHSPAVAWWYRMAADVRSRIWSRTRVSNAARMVIRNLPTAPRVSTVSVSEARSAPCWRQSLHDLQALAGIRGESIQFVDHEDGFAVASFLERRL
jgi:hypothetical protein